MKVLRTICIVEDDPETFMPVLFMRNALFRRGKPQGSLNIDTLYDFILNVESNRNEVSCRRPGMTVTFRCSYFQKRYLEYYDRTSSHKRVQEQRFPFESVGMVDDTGGRTKANELLFNLPIQTEIIGKPLYDNWAKKVKESMASFSSAATADFFSDYAKNEDVKAYNLLSYTVTIRADIKYWRRFLFTKPKDYSVEECNSIDELKAAFITSVYRSVPLLFDSITTNIFYNETDEIVPLEEQKKYPPFKFWCNGDWPQYEEVINWWSDTPYLISKGLGLPTSSAHVLLKNPETNRLIGKLEEYRIESERRFNFAFPGTLHFNETSTFHQQISEKERSLLILLENSPEKAREAYLEYVNEIKPRIDDAFDSSVLPKIQKSLCLDS